MKTYFAREALLPGGWARNVRIVVDGRGDFAEVTPDAQGGEPLAGPALPGMPSLHSHAFQRAMAGLTETRGDLRDDFWSWRELMYTFVAKLTPELAFAIARHLYVDMLKHGYTAVGEFHYVHNDIDGAPYSPAAELGLRHLEAARTAGIAITMLPSLYAHASFGRVPLLARQRRFRSTPEILLDMAGQIRRACGADPDCAVGVSAHSLRAVDPAELAELLAGARSLGENAPIHIHAAEQSREVESCVAWSGKRPVEWLLESAGIDRRWCVVHATHMTPEETRGLAASGAVAGLCPATEANLGDGIFPLLEYRAAGGCYGIGGDSHYSRDPIEELRLLEYVQRLAHGRRNLVVGGHSAAVGTTLWLEAAAGGAQALGRRCGRIEIGARADLVVLDAPRADLSRCTGDGIANALIFSGSTGLVREVAVAGRWVVRSGRHPDEEQVERDYAGALHELLAA
ncbi:MAG: formimidoylglutamate deiminase [Betaproteobacteria bacterium]|nr:formimidoylglutamate deiminase [Betaproteobacteria bacterium]